MWLAGFMERSGEIAINIQSGSKFGYWFKFAIIWTGNESIMNKLEEELISLGFMPSRDKNRVAMYRRREVRKLLGLIQNNIYTESRKKQIRITLTAINLVDHGVDSQRIHDKILDLRTRLSGFKK